MKKDFFLISAFLLMILSYFIITSFFTNFNPFIEKNFKYKINFCTNTSSDERGNFINVKVENNSIIFNQTLILYCNANNETLKLRYEHKNNEIIVKEVFDSKIIARCLCPTSIEGSIINLENGEYALKFLFINKYLGLEEELDYFEVKI